jgi:hypothetical protein
MSNRYSTFGNLGRGAMTKADLLAEFSDDDICRILAGVDDKILDADDPLAALAKMLGDAWDAEHPDQLSFEPLWA